MVSANFDSLLAQWMLARPAEMDRVPHRFDTERDQAAAHPAPKANATEAAEPLRLGPLVFDHGRPTMLAHRAVDDLG